MNTDVDWGAVERRADPCELLSPLVPTALLAGILALTGGLFGLEGTTAWLAVGGVLLLLVGLMVLPVPRWRARTRRGRRVLYALRHHVDPGAALRAAVDRHARRLGRLSWLSWCTPLLAAAVLPFGRWDDPGLAVPAACVLVGSGVAQGVLLFRDVRSARRWTADPPGPARPVPPPAALDTER